MITDNLDTGRLSENKENIFIFIGPTISREQAQQHLCAVYLPPVKFGDIYKITQLYQPLIIGIIDGYFNQVPAIWHKEILMALSKGINVFGASSMGALRAAELDQYGMKGVGKIYQAYQKGILPPFLDENFEDDDEVAVIHGPAELGYLAASEAMVNIRLTLAKAHQQNIIQRGEMIALANIAKALFYPERNYSTLISLARAQNFPTPTLNQLQQWIPLNKVDQKNIDAIALLSQINTATEQNPATKDNERETFQHTGQWQSAIDEIELSLQTNHPALNELRLKGDIYFSELEKALSDVLLPEQGSKQEEVGDLNLLHGRPVELDDRFKSKWQLMTATQTAQSLSSNQSDQLLWQYLDKSGQLNTLIERADDKIIQLKQQVNRETVNTLSELDLLQLSDWHFTQQLGIELPESLEEYVIELGLADSDEFYDMLLEEFYFLQIIS